MSAGEAMSVADMSVVMIGTMGTLATPIMSVEEDMSAAMTVLRGLEEDMIGGMTVDMTAPIMIVATLTDPGVAVVLGMLLDLQLFRGELLCGFNRLT